MSHKGNHSLLSVNLIGGIFYTRSWSEFYIPSTNRQLSRFYELVKNKELAEKRLLTKQELEEIVKEVEHDS